MSNDLILETGTKLISTGDGAMSLDLSDENTKKRLDYITELLSGQYPSNDSIKVITGLTRFSEDVFISIRLDDTNFMFRINADEFIGSNSTDLLPGQIILVQGLPSLKITRIDSLEPQNLKLSVNKALIRIMPDGQQEYPFRGENNRILQPKREDDRVVTIDRIKEDESTVTAYIGNYEISFDKSKLGSLEIKADDRLVIRLNDPLDYLVTSNIKYIFKIKETLLERES